MKLKPLTEQFVKAITEAAQIEGVVDYLVNYDAGLRENNKHDWSFWLKDGNRVDVAVGPDGGWAVNITNNKSTFNKE